MRVLYMHAPGNQIAGSEIVLMDIIKGLEPKCEHLVLVPEKEVFYHRLRSEGFNVRVLSLSGFNRHQPFLYIKEFWQVLKTIKKFKPDLIHTSSAAPVQYAYPISRLMHIPLVCHIQCPYGKDDLRRYFPYMADKIIAISDSVKAVFPNKYHPKITTVYNGINLPDYNRQRERRYILNEYKLPEPSKIIGIVGQIIHRKGLDILLKSLPDVLKYESIVQLLVVGDTQTKFAREMKTLSVELGVEDHVTWCGYQEEPQQLMAGMDILVVPSRSEGFGLVAAEALATETPVICSAVEGLTEIVTGDHNGYRVPVENVQHLSHKIKLLLHYPKMRAEFGRSGRQKVKETFSKPRQSDQIANIYQNLLVKKKTRKPWNQSTLNLSKV